MRKIGLVMLHEMRMSLSRMSFVGFAFILPLFLGLVSLVLILTRQGTTTEVTPEPVVDFSDVGQGYVDEGNLIQIVPDEFPLGELVAYGDVAAADQAVARGDIPGYFIIPADYVTSGNLTYITEQYMPLEDSVITSNIAWLLTVNLLGDVNRASTIWQPMALEVTSLATTETTDEEGNWIVDLMPTMMVLLVYMIVVLPAGMLVNAVTDEKKNRVMEQVLVSVSTRQFISGKILALGVLGLLETATWVGVYWFVARFGGQSLNIPPNFTIPTPLIFWAVVNGFLGYAVYGTLMAGLGALVPDVKDARSASMLLLSPLIAVYIFMIVILTHPDGPFALVMSLFPLTAPVGMIARMTVSDVPVWQAVLSAGLQVLTALFILRLVARLFRAQMLLSGQPFTMRRYFGLILARES